ncbi:MAG: PQQ-dependent dehydrogenase, methanol/ethanol family [Parvularculales bacterium]
MPESATANNQTTLKPPSKTPMTGVVLLALMAGVWVAGGIDRGLAQVSEGAGAIDGARIIAADSEPENWLAHGRTYDEQRFSPLDQITDDNVQDLGLAWSYETGTTRGLEASPIVVDGTLYTTGTWGIVQALNAATGEELWEYDPEVPGEWARYGCCDVVNRGVAVWKGRVYVASFDGRLIALDAGTGNEIWQVNTIDRSKPYTITGAPRIIKDKIIIGNGGAELGVRGYVSAYDVDSGELVWRFYTVPGNPDKPFEHPELVMAAETWKGGKWWEIGGGGTAWDSMAYDADLNMLYVGVGNGSPWTRHIRSPGGGDNLFLSSIIALNPDTGRLIWHYQTTPGDNWDYTATQHIILADMEIDGEPRKVLMQAPKNGFFYVLDRETGELLRADKYVTVTWASHVDMQTGRPVENEELNYDKTTQFILPSANGGHNWQPMAYNPETGLVYIPAQEVAGIYNLSEEWKERGTFTESPGWWNLGLDWGKYVETINALPELPVNSGYLKAWDPVAGQERWVVEHTDFWNGGVLTTSGNLVFQGTGDGRFVAYAADSGQILWEAPVLTGIIAPPVTYMVDGEQYIAIMAGWGGVGVPSGDARTSAAARYGNDGRLLTFKLGAKGRLPVLTALDTTIPEQPDVNISADALAEGGVLYMNYCGLCHGALVVSGGVLPDLRRMSPGVHDQFYDIVLDGLLKDNGMASFGDLLSREDAEKIYGYIVTRATQDRAAALETEN